MGFVRLATIIDYYIQYSDGFDVVTTVYCSHRAEMVPPVIPDELGTQIRQE